jgi:type VI secretion system secreted protein VgrG
MIATFGLSAPALGDDVVVVGFRGQEALSSPFRYDVFLALPSEAVPASDAVLATTATLSIQVDDRNDRVHGVVGRYQILGAADDRTLVLVTIEPRAADLGRSLHSRVWTGETIKSVITSILVAAGFAEDTDFAFTLTGTCPELAHVCQYKESDLAFITRWLEREGMYYFIDHRGDVDKLVISDDNGRHPKSPAAAIRYVPAVEFGTGGDTGTFDRFTAHKSVRPKSVKLADYDYMRPALDVSREEAASASTEARVVQHGIPSDEPDEARRLARVIADAHLAFEQRFSVAGRVVGLRSGLCFEVSEHPRQSLNSDYLCVTADLRGLSQRGDDARILELVGLPRGETFRVAATALLKKRQYRALALTPVPRVHAIERGNVDGPADGDYAQLDAEGRYHVKLAFDEGDRVGDRASLPIRMLQPHAGNPEGWHLPLRKHTEVMVAFLAGHPDRPVIVGAIPHAETPSPVTSANHSHNIFLSGGENILEIEDRDGEQWCDWRSPVEESYLHLGTPHDPTHHGSRERHSHYIVGNTRADALFSIGGDQDIRVGGKLTEEVGGDVKETYKTSQTTKVTGTQTTRVKNDVIEKYTGGHRTEVTGAVKEFYNSKQTTKVTGERWETYNAAQHTLVTGATKQTFNAGQNLTVNGPSVQVYRSTKRSTASGAAKYQFDADVVQFFGPVLQMDTGTNWKVTGNGKLTAGSVTVMAGQTTYEGSNRDLLGAIKFHIYLLWIAAGVLKLEGFGVDVCVGGFRLAKTPMAAELFGAKIQLLGMKTGAHGHSGHGHGGRHE